MDSIKSGVGFVGVGAMGSAIASRLVDGYRLLVNDLNPRAADALIERGARFASLEQIAQECDVIVLSLPGPDDVLSLLAEDGPLAPHLRPATVVIDTTTSTPAVDQQIASRLARIDVGFVDAPIAGGVRRAYSGDASLMVGASEADFDRVEPILRTVTGHVFHLGPVGAGHAAKLVNNLLNACLRFSAIETVTLAERYGIAPDRMIAVLNASSGRSYVTEYTYPEIVATGARQGFTLDLMRKDVRLANELAEEVGLEMRVAPLVLQMMNEAVDRLGGRTDQTDLMTNWYASDAT